MSLRLLLSAAVCAMSLTSPAFAQGLFGEHGLDPKWCNQKTVRQTVVYVDDMVMYEGQTGWVPKLDEKLKGTLVTGERVTVVRLSPDAGRSHEEWSGCWPGATEGAAAETSGGLNWLFEASPASRIDSQRKFFFAEFGGALTRIYKETRRQPATIDTESPPQKQILRALASDDGRFAGSETTIRAILYSDMAENSDLGSAFKGAAAAGDYGRRLGSYLRHGVFYGFGLGLDIGNDAPFGENARAFWNAALRSMAATVEGIDADLNVPNTLPIAAYTYPVEMQFQGQTLDGKLSLLVGTDGNLVDSWIGIARLGSAALNGTFACTASGTAVCRLQAETSSGLATNAPLESLTLRGKGETLTGTLQVKSGNLSFPVRTPTAE